MNLTQNNKAVSPIIGVLLMVALTATLVSLIATSILPFNLNPSPPPEAKLFFESSFDNPHKIQIRHKGGDPINLNQTKIYIYQIDIPPYIFNPTGTLSTGQRLELPPIQQTDIRVVLVHIPTNKIFYSNFLTHKG